MTNEEAIEILNDNYTTLNTHGHYTEEEEVEALQMAIEALEQESILDKIRDEIVHLHDWAFSREEILRIIDKYKAESEG